MSITCSVELNTLDQEAFHGVDNALMRYAFDVHNEFGRFLDERIYRDEVARRCRRDGRETGCELMVSVRHGDFRKDYFLDLVIDSGVIYELKSVSELTAPHVTQLVHYLMLTGQSHGKLVNFGGTSVESRFVSTGFTPEKRKMFNVGRSGWQVIGDRSKHLEEILVGLLEDLGACLQVSLYNEAVIHFLGGWNKVMQPVEVYGNGGVAGVQEVCLLDESVALHLSSVSRYYSDYKKHLNRFLRHTKLKALQWVNLNKTDITFKTLVP